MSLAISLHVGTPFWCDVETVRRTVPTFQPDTHAASPRAVPLQLGVVRRVFMSVATVGSQLFPPISAVVMCSMPQHSIRMKVVSGARHPFEIFRTVVSLVSVKVVHLKGFIARLAAKGECYESGNLPFAATISTSQQNMLVTSPLGSRLQYSSDPRALPSGITPDSSEARRTIETKVAGDWVPIFGNHWNIVSHSGMFSKHEEELR